MNEIEIQKWNVDEYYDFEYLKKHHSDLRYRRNWLMRLSSLAPFNLSQASQR